MVCCSVFLIAAAGIDKENMLLIELNCKAADVLYSEGSSSLSLGSAGYKF